jgi:hypothetical protein
MDLLGHRSVLEFFHDQVCAAMRNQGVDSSELTEFYLVNLLSDYARMTIDERALALRLSEAATALPDERARTLRDIGDQSLYVSGFFSDSLRRGPLQVDYYIQIGGTAYRQLAGMNAGAAQPFGEVYRELAGKFPRFVDVLAEVSTGSAITRPEGVVELYERWIESGSEWIERKLRAQGVVPKKGDLQ